jgi:phage terminase large subunit
MPDMEFGFQDKQLELVDAILDPGRKAVYFGYGGPKFGGKSFGLRNVGLLLAMKYPGLPILLLRQTYQDLIDNHVTQLFLERPGIKEYWKSNENMFRLPNGSSLRMGYMETLSDTYNYWGKEFPIILWDEAQQAMEKQFKIVATSRRIPALLKQKYPSLKPAMIMGFNWGDVGHGWLKRLFYDRKFLPEEDPNDYYPLITAKYTDNKIGTDADPDYIKTLKQLPEDERRAYLDGDPNSFSGQFFKDYRIVDTKPIRKLGKVWLYGGLDWGHRDPAANYLISVDTSGKHTVCREIYGAGMSPESLAGAALEHYRGLEIQNTYADPKTWSVDQYGRMVRGGGELQDYQEATEHSIADQIQAAGLTLARATNDRVAGWTRLKTLMHNGQFEVMDCCKELRRELEYAVYNTKDQGKREDLDKTCSDHALDAVRYACMHTRVPDGPAYDTDKPSDPLQQAIADLLAKADERASEIPGQDEEDVDTLAEYDSQLEPAYND